MPTINIRGTLHTYELLPSRSSVNSSGDVLVFIHGWLLSRRYWQPLIDRLILDFSCLSYDLRGFGASHIQPHIQKQRHSTLALSSNAYTPQAYADDLLTLLQQLKINHAWLVGHCWGASIAIWSAALQPNLVQGVTCLNGGGGIYLKEEFERFRTIGQQLIQLRPRWLCQLPLLDLLFARASVAQSLERFWGRQRILDFVLADYEAALGTLWASTTETEVHQLPQIVARLKQPVYFISGLNDPITEPKYVRQLASFHPLFQDCGKNLIELPNCGHLSMVEQPERLADALRQMLKGS